MTSRDRLPDMTLCVLRHLFLLAMIVARQLVTPCSFPDTLQMQPRDPPWYSHVRTDGSRDTEYYIRHNVMEIHSPKSNRPNVRWKCTAPFHNKLLLKRQDHLVNNYYRCVRFMFRSRSVVQILWSHEVKSFDLGLCDDINLKPDPWLLIWYGTLEEDYFPCPFNGGFDMKVVDSLLGENGCNYMLRPMRLEVECLGGEGLTFDFMSSNCLPGIKMYVKQRTICIAGWQDERNHYVILRRNEDVDLWCFVVPIHRNANFTAHLFSDLACVSDAVQLRSMSDLRYFTLHLHERVFASLCEDEYQQCNTVTCNQYVRQECQKSCDVCDSTQHPVDCEFPTDYSGDWFLKDASGYSNIAIAASTINMSRVGSFVCSIFPNSPPRPSPLYTTVTLSTNGCRPRYSCIRLHRLGPSVLQYSLSQSYSWPTSENDIGVAVCNEDRFYPDPSPIDDRYRPHEGAGKPIVAHTPTPVACNLTSVLSVNVTFPDETLCPGSLYRHCEDTTRLRLTLNPTCRNSNPATTDFTCLANFEGHYWERILLVYNILDHKDVVCFVFSQFYPNEAYSLVASECDQKSFSFARSGLRQPLLKLEIRSEHASCQSIIPVTHSTIPPTKANPTSSPSSNSQNEDRDDHIAVGNITTEDLTYHIPVPVVEGDYFPGKLGHAHQKGKYLDTRIGSDTPSAKSTSARDESFLGAGSGNVPSSHFSASLWIFPCVLSVMCR